MKDAWCSAADFSKENNVVLGRIVALARSEFGKSIVSVVAWREGAFSAGFLCMRGNICMESIEMEYPPRIDNCYVG